MYLSTLIFCFGGIFVVNIASLIINKETDWVALSPNVILESFMLLGSLVTAIQLAFFLSYVMESKKQVMREK